MIRDKGALGARPSDQALAVPVEPVSRLDPSGFDPSRGGFWHGAAMGALLGTLIAKLLWNV